MTGSCVNRTIITEAQRRESMGYIQKILSGLAELKIKYARGMIGSKIKKVNLTNPFHTPGKGLSEQQ